MNKIVDGVELFKMIKDEVLKNGTKLKDTRDGEIYIITDTRDRIIRADEKATFLDDYTVADDLILSKFEILSEEDKEIDIQSIELFGEIRDVSDWSNNTLSHNQRSIISKVNKIIKAIKQLDKKIK